jgi:hypothetical protein
MLYNIIISLPILDIDLITLYTFIVVWYSNNKIIIIIIIIIIVRAEVSAVTEPAGVSRTDGKRPDGVTLVPWQAGRTAVWDVTVIDTLATPYLPSTSITPGSAAGGDCGCSKSRQICKLLCHSHICAYCVGNIGPYQRAVSVLFA